MTNQSETNADPTPPAASSANASFIETRGPASTSSRGMSERR